MKFQVDEQIFKSFPGLSIGLVLIKGADNSVASSEVEGLLAKMNESVREEWSAEKITEEPRIISWREAYRSFKAKPKKYKSSIENLYSMILNGRDLFSISNLVDLYNVISLKHCIPAGGDDLDKIDGDITLCFAKGDERFIPLNGTDSMPPKPGEVVYRDSSDILCRRWNWRECDKSKITEESTNVALVLEGLLPVTADNLKQAGEELAESILQYCGGKIDITIINADCLTVDI